MKAPIQPIPIDPVKQSDDALRGIVLSDLHLFSGRQRSEVEIWLAQHHPHYHHWVFNGDILDIKWAPWSPEESARRALDWMADFAQRHPQAQVHWVMGNHDGYDVLERIFAQAKLPANLHWYPEYVLLGDHLFLHGDLLLVRKPLARRFWTSLPGMKSDKARENYDKAMNLHLHRVAATLMQPRLLVPWMARHLPVLHPEAWARARHIITGHSHRPYLRFPSGGKLWSNTGSAVRGIRFTPLEFIVEPS